MTSHKLSLCALFNEMVISVADDDDANVRFRELVCHFNNLYQPSALIVSSDAHEMRQCLVNIHFQEETI